MRSATQRKDGEDLRVTQTLGSLRLVASNRGNHVFLIPTPSDSPDDPLNWSQARKYYITALVSFSVFLSAYLFSAPAVQLVTLATQFGEGDKRNFSHLITQAAYFISSCNLLQGVGNILWMPLANKYGRRHVYIISWLMCLGCVVWSIKATSYASELASRIMIGFTAGASDCIAPLTVSEIFFLHERGKIMGFLVFCLGGGASIGLVLGGLITINLSWEYILWISIPFIGVTWILMVFTFPETNFKRNIHAPRMTMAEYKQRRSRFMNGDAEQSETDKTGTIHTEDVQSPGKSKYWQSLKLFHGSYTEESLLRMIFRPLVGVLLPPILWATCTMGVNIGFLVIVSSNVFVAFSQLYHFQAYQISLCWISGVIGSTIAIYIGGAMSDWVAQTLTKRNGGIREPEMRLPSLIIAVIFGPLSLILYGFGIYYKLHWMVPTLGLGFLGLAAVASSGVSTTYTVDAYRPIAGETVVTKMVFKAVVGFILSCYATPWIDAMGYRDAFGTMAGIYVAVYLLGIPLYIWGRKIRRASITWRVTRPLHWHEDRETGE